jgi:hypothetical protein
MRRIMTSTVLALVVLIALMVIGTPVSGGYVRFSCGGNGFSSLLAATNWRGETLLAWQDGRQSGGGFCESTVADAAVGSVSGGFAALGSISAPGTLSYATGVSLDGAGDGWVIGLHEKYVGEEKYGPHFEKSGVWAAFRPAGAGFRAPVELPIKDPWQETEAWVASNRAGKTLLAWGTYSGTYLAFATDTGAISRPTFVGGGFQIAGLGVDERGRALVVGYYGSRRFDVVRIAAVTGSVSGSFSRPRLLASQPRSARKGVVGHFEQPVVAIGPRGNAVIAWYTGWVVMRTEDEFAGPNLLLYRRADGRFDKPVRLSSRLLHDPREAAVGGSGQAVLVSANGNGNLEEIAISPDGRVGRPHRLRGSVDEMYVAANESGQTAIAWVNGRHIDVIVGNTSGFEEKPQLITTFYEVLISGVTVTMGPQGVATMFWVEEPKKGETTLWARAVAPGAQPVQVASSEVSTS